MCMLCAKDTLDLIERIKVERPGEIDESLIDTDLLKRLAGATKDEYKKVLTALALMFRFNPTALHQLMSAMGAKLVTPEEAQESRVSQVVDDIEQNTVQESGATPSHVEGKILLAPSNLKVRH